MQIKNKNTLKETLSKASAARAHVAISLHIVLKEKSVSEQAFGQSVAPQ